MEADLELLELHSDPQCPCLSFQLQNMKLRAILCNVSDGIGD
jgi:hypothetical protein